jgi:hypothetical protein
MGDLWGFESLPPIQRERSMLEPLLGFGGSVVDAAFKNEQAKRAEALKRDQMAQQRDEFNQTNMLSRKRQKALEEYQNGQLQNAEDKQRDLERQHAISINNSPVKSLEAEWKDVPDTAEMQPWLARMKPAMSPEAQTTGKMTVPPAVGMGPSWQTDVPTYIKDLQEQAGEDVGAARAKAAQEKQRAGAAGNPWMQKKAFDELNRIDRQLVTLGMPKDAVDALVSGKLPPEAVKTYGEQRVSQARQLMSKRSQLQSYLNGSGPAPLEFSYDAIPGAPGAQIQGPPRQAPIAQPSAPPQQARPGSFPLPPGKPQITAPMNKPNMGQRIAQLAAQGKNKDEIRAIMKAEGY